MGLSLLSFLHDHTDIQLLINCEVLQLLSDLVSSRQEQLVTASNEEKDEYVLNDRIVVCSSQLLQLIAIRTGLVTIVCRVCYSISSYENFVCRGVLISRFTDIPITDIIISDSNADTDTFQLQVPYLIFPHYVYIKLKLIVLLEYFDYIHTVCSCYFDCFITE